MTLPLPNPWVTALPAPKPLAGPHSVNPDDLLLHLGEAWFPPAPEVRAALSQIHPERYPDSLSQELREELARYCGHGILPENVIVGNGSDALIDLLVSAYAGPERAVVAPAPTFFVYGHAAALRRAPLVTTGRLAQEEGFTLDFKPPGKAGIVFLASPNNPTGDLIEMNTLERIAQSTAALLVIDECYFEFAGVTALPLLARYPNVVILRSLSKSFALAGLRCGYALAHPDVIATLTKADQTFSVNVAAQTASLAALRALDYYRPIFGEVDCLRDRWVEMLEEAGLKVFPSRANILLAQYSGDALAPRLRQLGIHVADFHSRPPIHQSVRITLAGPDAWERVRSTLARLKSS